MTDFPPLSFQHRHVVVVVVRHVHYVNYSFYKVDTLAILLPRIKRRDSCF